MRYTYLVTVDTSDERPMAKRRHGLELARALHNGSIPNAQVFHASQAEMGDPMPIRFDPKRTIESHLEDSSWG